MISFLWKSTRGYRLRPWDSPYLRWRIETYWGLHAERIGGAAHAQGEGPAVHDVGTVLKNRDAAPPEKWSPRQRRPDSGLSSRQQGRHLD